MGLYVGAAGRVIELGIGNYTKMVVSPAELTFSAQECDPQPADQYVTVSNGGPGILSFTITSDSAWLTTSTNGDTISGVGSVDVAVSVDKSGLSAGTYTGTLTVTSVSGVQTVTVTLTVLSPSTLNVSPWHLERDIRQRLAWHLAVERLFIFSSACRRGCYGTEQRSAYGQHNGRRQLHSGRSRRGACYA
jgi:hypothetical protein